jgi:polysaccharide biosynthesis transport protein
LLALRAAIMILSQATTMQTLHTGPSSRAPRVLYLAGLSVLFSVAAGVSAASQGEQPKEESAPAVYAVLHVAKEPPRLLPGPSADAQGFPGYLHLQAGLLTSRPVLNRALKHADVAKLAIVKQQKDPLTWLEQRLKVRADPETGTLRVGVAAGPPDEQATLTNAVVEAYLTEVREADRRDRMNRLERLKALHREYETRLEEKRRVLRAAAQKLGKDGTALQLNQQFALEQLRAVEKELLEVQAQIRKAKIEAALAKMDETDQAPEASVPPAKVEEALNRDSGVGQLLEEIASLEQAVAAWQERTANPAKEPGYRYLVQRREAVKEHLSAQRDRLRPALAKQLAKERQDEFTAKQQAAKRQLRRLSKVEQLLSEERDARLKALQDLGKPGANLEWVNEEMRLLEETTRALDRQVQLLTVELEAPPRVKLLQKAEAPPR